VSAGTVAAGGVALSASINVNDRPLTGQGVMGMRAQTGMSGRLVEDASYYVGLIRKKMTDVNNETNRLRNEIEQQSKDSSQFAQLEKRYETLLKNKEQLEGTLADYNLAMDKTRTSTDTEDVQQLAIHMAEKNRQTSQELDRVFMQRKQRENDTMQVEEQIEAQYRAIQARINDLEPGKLRAYNELLSKQRELQDRVMHSDNRLTEINARIRHYDADDKGTSHRKEYANLERVYQSLRKDAESLQEELEIASMDPKEAHSQFVARVNNFKTGAKTLEDKATQLREENAAARRALDEMDTTVEEDNGDAAKYELLVKRDQDMTAFMDKFDESRDAVLAEQQQAKDVIVALLEHISRGLEDSTNMPTQEALGEMEDARTFKERNLATAQRTMEGLQAEKRKRERELELLRDSEPKLNRELTMLRESMARMESEMRDFEDLQGLRRAFENTQAMLVEQKQSYVKRRDAMRQQVQAASVEHEAAKRALSNHDTARELDDTEKRLKHYERSIFELREFVEIKSRETDFEAVKASCLKVLRDFSFSLEYSLTFMRSTHQQISLTSTPQSHIFPLVQLFDNLNSVAIRKSQQVGGQAYK